MHKDHVSSYKDLMTKPNIFQNVEMAAPWNQLGSFQIHEYVTNVSLICS